MVVRNGLSAPFSQIGTETLDIATEWLGGSEFKIWPPLLRLAPGQNANVYVQYTAEWEAAPVEGWALLRVCCAESRGGACACAGGRCRAGAWCRAAVPVRAAPTRDHKFHRTRHDHTDDARLLPPGLTSRGTDTDD